MRSFPAISLKLLDFSDVHPGIISPGWATNGHWLARCRDEMQPILTSASTWTPDRIASAIHELSGEKRTPMTHLGLVKGHSCDEDFWEAFTDADGNITAIDARYAPLLEGMDVVRIDGGQLSPVIGNVAFPGNLSLAGIDATGEVVSLVLPRSAT